MKKFIISIIMLFTVFSVKADEVEPLYVVVSCTVADRFIIFLKQTNGERERIIRPHDFDFRIGAKNFYVPHPSLVKYSPEEGNEE